jgi:hypothetical protein
VLNGTLTRSCESLPLGPTLLQCLIGPVDGILVFDDRGDVGAAFDAVSMKPRKHIFGVRKVIWRGRERSVVVLQIDIYVHAIQWKLLITILLGFAQDLLLFVVSVAFGNLC